MVEWTILGLRDALGRFASVSDSELLVRRFGETEALAQEIARIYRETAPKSKEPRRDDKRTEKFSESLHGMARVTGTGFEVGVDTEQRELAGWLKHGTAPHPIPKDGSTLLAWTGGSFGAGWHFAMHVNHPGTQANPWEERAMEEAAVVMREHGNKIGGRVMRHLAGHGGE